MTTPPPNFIHAADLHLGAPLQSLGAKLGRSSEKAAELRRLASQSLHNLVDTALQRQAAFVVLSGDVYDSADREVSSQISFERELRRLRNDGAAGPIPVFVVHGNHDPLIDGFDTSVKLPDNVHVFGSGAPSVEAVEVAGIGRVDVAGVSFSSQSESTNLVQSFGSLSIDRAVPSVGVVHANVGGVAEHGNYAPCSKDDLASASIGYWALGHVHKQTITPTGPGRWWAYPGNLQGRSTKPTECGAKGALSVGLTPGGFARPEFLACDSVRFERLELDVTNAGDLSEMVQMVAENATALSATSGGRPSLIAVELVGRTAIHGALRGLSKDQLLEQCREEIAGGLGLGELLRVRISTLPEADLAALSTGVGLLAEVLRFLETVEAGDDPELVEQMGAQLSKELHSSIVKVVEPDQHLPELVAAARRILVDELLGSEVR